MENVTTQKLKTEGYYLHVDFINKANGGFVLTPVFIHEEKQLQCYYEVLDCHCIDKISLPNNVEFIVDEEGLLKSGNLVYELEIKPLKQKIHVAGCFLVGTIVGDGVNGYNFAGYKTLEELRATVKETIGSIVVIAKVK